VYGKQVLLPIEFQIKTFRIVVQFGMNLDEAHQQRLLQLNELVKSGRKHFKEPPLLKSREQNGMTSISKRKIFNQEIGPYCMTTGSRTSKVS
jgi:hypothetical protein